MDKSRKKMNHKNRWKIAPLQMDQAMAWSLLRFQPVFHQVTNEWSWWLFFWGGGSIEFDRTRWRSMIGSAAIGSVASRPQVLRWLLFFFSFWFRSKYPNAIESSPCERMEFICFIVVFLVWLSSCWCVGNFLCSFDSIASFSCAHFNSMRTDCCRNGAAFDAGPRFVRANTLSLRDPLRNWRERCWATAIVFRFEWSRRFRRKDANRCDSFSNPLARHWGTCHPFRFCFFLGDRQIRVGIRFPSAATPRTTQPNPKGKQWRFCLKYI